MGSAALTGVQWQRSMLTTQTRLRLQAILRRLASGCQVTLAERIELHTFADHDSTVAAWLRRACRRQRQRQRPLQEDVLLQELDLGCSEPDGNFHADRDDLEDWFGGAPSWLRRS